jgi:ABC-type nitrate/sulfonate/bicarbonate transport system substrate-binding protein
MSVMGSLNTREVPPLMALESLREQGYTTEAVSIPRAELIVEALLRGDLEVGAVTPTTLWAAIAKGADLRTIAARSTRVSRLVARREIQTCRDLQDRSVAFNNLGNTDKAMFDAYLRQHCPDVTPRIVVIADSANRTAALQAGRIDSAELVELDHWLYLEDNEPGRFNVLLDFATEFPGLGMSSFAVRSDWARQNPESVKDFLRALLMVYRRVAATPLLLQEESAKRLFLSPAEAERLTGASLAANVWDVNGGLTEANVQATIDFLTGTGSLPTGMRAEDVADLTYLDAVLDEIGRR